MTTWRARGRTDEEPGCDAEESLAGAVVEDLEVHPEPSLGFPDAFEEREGRGGRGVLGCVEVEEALHVCSVRVHEERGGEVGRLEDEVAPAGGGRGGERHGVALLCR